MSTSNVIPWPGVPIIVPVSTKKPPATTYNKGQWIASFEGQMAIVRPHLTGRILAAMSVSAWHRHGTKNVDPIEAARDEAKALDEQNPVRKTRLAK